MLNLGQTLRKKNSDELYLYLGLDMTNKGEVSLVDESGELLIIPNKEFYANYTHLVDKDGKPIVGKYGLPVFCGVLTYTDDMLPDLELKNLLQQEE